MTHIEVVRNYLQCWGRQDMKNARQLLSSDCTFNDPLWGNALPADMFIEQTQVFVQSIKRIVIVSIIESEEWVASYYILNSGQIAEMAISEWFKMERGKIKFGQLLYDTQPFRGKTQWSLSQPISSLTQS